LAKTAKNPPKTTALDFHQVGEHRREGKTNKVKTDEPLPGGKIKGEYSQNQEGGRGWHSFEKRVVIPDQGGEVRQPKRILAVLLGNVAKTQQPAQKKPSTRKQITRM